MYRCAGCNALGDLHYVGCPEISLKARAKRWWFTPRLSSFELLLISFLLALIKAFMKWMF